MTIDGFAPPRRAHLLAGAALILLAACGGESGSGTGGGGTGSTPTPTPPATAPQITSPASVDVAENVAGDFFTATASDPQGDAIAFDIYSGPDASAFAMSPGGALRFNQAPNYDLPTDANGDNVYQITLRATAGGEQTTRDLAIRVTNDFEGIAVTRIATGLVNPVGIAPLWTDLNFVVAEKGGKIFELNGETGALSEMTDVAGKFRPGEILDVAYYFDGQPYAEGLLLLTHSNADGLLFQAASRTSSRTYSWQLAAPWSVPVKAALFTSNRPNGGGSIYAAIGDPGGSLAQDSASGYGKLWEITARDPYAGASLPRGLTYNVDKVGDGIQAPDGGGIFFDRTMLVDQGSSAAHEISLFRYDQNPIDFGWPFYEGTVAVRANPPAAAIVPSLTYEFGNGKKQGQGIIAGAGYAGNIPGIQGHFVFGDKSGKIWSIPSDTLNNGSPHNATEIQDRTEDFTPNVGKIDSPVAFALSFQRLFILDADGEIFRVDPR